MRKIGDGKTKSPEFIVCVVVREKDEEKLQQLNVLGFSETEEFGYGWSLNHNKNNKNYQIRRDDE